MNQLAIPTFIINLKKRTKRRQHALNAFLGRDEFNVTIVDAFEEEIGAVGLWNTIKHILSDLVKEEHEYVLICEDDHQFTEAYSKELLFSGIAQACDKNATVLLGGVSWFSGALQVTDTLFWVRNFTGAQFMIVFKELFNPILEADFEKCDAADYKISALTKNKFFMYPYISIQKDFGYSDVTIKNNQEGRVDKLFIESADWVEKIRDVTRHYKDRCDEHESRSEIYDNIIIPTYVINMPGRTERLEHIRKQFEDKPELDVTIIEACNHVISAVGLWQSIRKVVNIAIENDDDVIILCGDNHEFTSHYSKDYLLENIIAAYEQGVNYLSGGSTKTENEIMVSANRYWISSCLGTQFVVLYKRVFKKIIDEPFDNNVIADILLSKITSNKMVLYPFISTQKDFGYLDIPEVYNEHKVTVQDMFAAATKKLEDIKEAHETYNKDA